MSPERLLGRNFGWIVVVLLGLAAAWAIGAVVSDPDAYWEMCKGVMASAWQGVVRWFREDVASFFGDLGRRLVGEVRKAWRSS